MTNEYQRRFERNLTIAAGTLMAIAGISLASKLPVVEEYVIQPAKDYAAQQVEGIKSSFSIERLFDRITDTSR